MSLISHRIRLVIAVILLFLLAFIWLSALADSSDPYKFEAAVKLIVSADGPLEGIVRSYVLQRLRLLDGVVITDVDPGYRLGVVVVETKSKAAGTHAGYAISSVGSMLWKRSDIEEILMDAYGSYQELSLFIPAWANSGNINHHLLIIGTNLEEMCKELVASFDTDELDYPRKLYTQQLRDKSK